LLDFNPKSIDFSIVTFHRHENRWDSIVRTAEIFPYFKGDLEGLLRKVGFKKMDFYRNFNFEDYDKNGTDLIVVCEKKGTLKGKLTGRNLAGPEKAIKGSRTVSSKAKEAVSEKPGGGVSGHRRHYFKSPKELRQSARKSKKSHGKKGR
jgi:hypothetical protein